MKIAHVLSSFEIGGQEKMARDLACGQVQLGHDVVSVSLADAPDGPLGAEFRAGGVRPARVSKRHGFDPTLPLRLAHFFRKEGIDVVHSHNHLPLVYAPLAARMASARAVHTRHGRFIGRPHDRLLRWLAVRFVDSYVAVSDDAANVARRLGETAKDGVSVIENGIDTTRFNASPDERAAVRRELSLPEDAWVFGSVGRFVKEKNYGLLVRAVAPLLGDRCHLLLIGDGPEAPALRNEVASLPLRHHVHLPGMRGDVPRLMAALDAFVLSSLTEGLPLVLLEAMAAALPVVSTAVGGIPAVLKEGGAGVLVPPGDEVALRSALSALVADPAAAIEMGRRGRTRAVDRYDRRRMIDAYLALYEKARAGSKKRSSAH